MARNRHRPSTIWSIIPENGPACCSHGIRVSDLGVPVDGKAISNCSDQVSMYVSDHDPLIDRIARVLAGGTSRRIVLGAVASAAVGFVRGPIPGSLAKANIGQTVRYFALGDSVASGHGLLDNDGSACVPNGVSCCHRSRLAYPWIVSELLTDLGYEVVFADGQHLACSSARSEHLNGQIDILLDQLDGRSPEDAVLLSITIGVNDFAWDSPPSFHISWRVTGGSLSGWTESSSLRLYKSEPGSTACLRTCRTPV